MLGLAFFKYMFLWYLKKKFKTGFLDQVSPRDFTLLCKIKKKGLRFDDKLEDVVYQAINGNYFNNQINFLKICPVHDIRELMSVTKKLLKIEKNLMISGLKVDRAIIDLGSTRTFKREELQEEKQQLKEKLKALKTDFEANPLEKFTGWVFVTFETVKDLKEVVRRKSPILHSFWTSFGSNWHPISEPNDIIWENWGVSMSRRMLLRVIVLILALLIVIVNLGAILFLKYIQKLANGNDTKGDSIGSVFVSIAISLCIGIFNFLIKTLLIFVTRFEMFQTKTTYFASIVFKVSAALFANRALILLFVSKILYNDWGIFGSSKLTGTVFISIFITMAIDLTLFILDPTFVVRWYKRRLIRNETKIDKLPFLQLEANEAFEGLNFDIAEAYFLVFSSVYLAFFYQAVLPYGLLATVFEVGVKFAVIKYVLVKRCKRPHNLEVEFTLDMFRQFEYGIGILAIGYMVFAVILTPTGTNLGALYILALIFGGFEMFFGSKIWSFFWRRRGKGDITETFDFYEKSFPVDYDRLNPTTQSKAFPKFLEKIKMNDPRTTSPLDQIAEAEDDKLAMEDYAVYSDSTVPLVEKQVFKISLSSTIKTRNHHRSQETQLPNLYLIQEDLMFEKQRLDATMKDSEFKGSTDEPAARRKTRFTVCDIQNTQNLLQKIKMDSDCIVEARRASGLPMSGHMIPPIQNLVEAVSLERQKLDVEAGLGKEMPQPMPADPMDLDYTQTFEDFSTKPTERVVKTSIQNQLTSDRVMQVTFQETKAELPPELTDRPPDSQMPSYAELPKKR